MHVIISLSIFLVCIAIPMRVLLRIKIINYIFYQTKSIVGFKPYQKKLQKRDTFKNLDFNIKFCVNFFSNYKIT